MTERLEHERPIRVVVADDSPDVVALLRYTLDLDARFEVVAEAGNGAEALAAVRAERPDAVVLDLAMPEMDGMSAIPLIRQEAPNCRVVVLSGFERVEAAHEALARGAHVYLEKGATFSDLTAVLAEQCRGPRPLAPEEPAPDPQLRTGAEVLAEGHQDANDGVEAVRATRQVDAVMRQARWIGVLFAVVQFALYKAPPGVRVPFPRLTTGLLFGAVFAGANLLARWAAQRSADERFLDRLGLAELAFDCMAIMTLVWMFAFDATSALWALIIIVVLEGAMRRGVRGAIGVWAVCSALYVARDVWAAHAFHDGAHTVAADSLTYRLGIVLIVAVTTGHLARNFTEQARRHLQARAESERRAHLLTLVAAAGRTMAGLEAGRLQAQVVESALALGFHGAELCEFDALNGAWTTRLARGIAAGPVGDPWPIDSGIAGAVWRRRETLLLEDYSSWPGALPGTRAAGFRAVAALPIWTGEQVRAALIVGSRDSRTVGANELECLELLAAQAGVCMANAELLERIRHQAMHDSLTGLPNQILFEDRVSQALAQAGRSNERAAVLFLDLDRFKKVNDSLGHDFGNELLKQVAGRLLSAVRKGDTVARMGGDEFTLLLPGLRSPDDATISAARILESFQTPFVVGRHELFISASIGIALYPSDGLRFEALLKHADIAMYRAKARGGASAELFFGRSGGSLYPRLSLEADLHNAIDSGQLHVVYQPMYDVVTGGILGVEALARWRHHMLGMIGPDEFIPLAEEAGLIVAIDTHVLRTACAQVRAWADRGLPPVSLAVNLSGRHLEHPAMPETVVDALRGAGLRSDALELEVTESVAVAESTASRDALEGLRGLGVRVAIDDFGTGYSMLSRLRDFPLDTLKVDRSFVQEILHAEEEAPIVAATIAMAHSLGLRVVAEGVETEAQLCYLRARSCDVAQGYLLSRPVEADEVEALLRSRAGVPSSQP